MNIFSFLWIGAVLVVFPLGYQYILSLLIISSIFQYSALISNGTTSIPIFYFVEIILILRFLLPYKKSNTIAINSNMFLYAIFLIIYFWISSFFLANLFSGVKVYSASLSFEENFVTGGVGYQWSSSNINQLILISLNILTCFVIYQRRHVINSSFALKALVSTAVIFSLYSLIWLFYRPAAEAIQDVIYNSSHHANAIFENRLSGTFGEPSFAGVFIGSLIVPFFIMRGITLKLLSVFFLFLLLMNGSSSGFITFLASIVILFAFYFNSNVYIKPLSMMAFIFFVVTVFLLTEDYIYAYMASKSESTSGIVRAASNFSAVNIMIETLGLGLGIGSARISSLILSMLVNFGIPGVILLFLYINKSIGGVINCLSSKDNHDGKKIFSMILLSVFVGSCSANPDYSYGFMWSLIFIVITSKKQSYNE